MNQSLMIIKHKRKNIKIFLSLIILIFIVTSFFYLKNISDNKKIKTEEYNENDIQDDRYQVFEIERDLEKFEGKKLIALTFDDGPNPSTTELLLDNLDKYEAKVTFFVIGNRVSKYKDTVKRAYEEGNQIGNHTFSHLDLLKLDLSEAIEEVNKTNKEIEDIIGVRPRVIRPPFGYINENIKKKINMVPILWDVDTLDWENKDSNFVKNSIIQNAHDGAIILLHDLYETSIEGAFMAMEELYEEGYAFVTIDELAYLKGLALDTLTSYRNIK